MKIHSFTHQSPQNTLGVPGVKSVAAESNTIELKPAHDRPTASSEWAGVETRRPSLHTVCSI